MQPSIGRRGFTPSATNTGWFLSGYGVVSSIGNDPRRSASCGGFHLAPAPRDHLDLIPIHRNGGKSMFTA